MVTEKKIRDGGEKILSFLVIDNFTRKCVNDVKIRGSNYLDNIFRAEYMKLYSKLNSPTLLLLLLLPYPHPRYLDGTAAIPFCCF